MEPNPDQQDPSLGPIAIMCGQLLIRYLSNLWTHFTANFNFKAFCFLCVQLFLKVVSVVTNYLYSNFSLKGILAFSGRMVMLLISSVWIWVLKNVNLTFLAHWGWRQSCESFTALWNFMQTQISVKVVFYRVLGLSLTFVWWFWSIVFGVFYLGGRKDSDVTMSSGEEDEEDYEDEDLLEQKAFLDKVAALEEAIRTRHAAVVAAADQSRDHALASLVRCHQQQLQRQQEQGDQPQSPFSASTAVRELLSKLMAFANSREDVLGVLSSLQASDALLLKVLRKAIRQDKSFQTGGEEDPKLKMLCSVLDAANGTDGEVNSAMPKSSSTNNQKTKVKQRRKFPNLSKSEKSTVERPVLRFNATATDVVESVRSFLGQVESMEMQVNMGCRDVVEEMFQCSNEEGGDGESQNYPNAEVSSLNLLPDNTVQVTYTTNGLRQDRPSEVRDKLGKVLKVLPQDNYSPPTTDVTTAWYSPWKVLRKNSAVETASYFTGASPEQNTFLQAKRRSLNGDRIWLQPDVTSGGACVVKGSWTSGGEPPVVLVNFPPGHYFALDVDFREELFVLIVEEKYISKSGEDFCGRRVVRLYRRPPCDKGWTSTLLKPVSSQLDSKKKDFTAEFVAQYVPPAPEFHPSDVCIFPVCKSQMDDEARTVVMIADEVNDAVHVVDLVMENEQASFSSSSSFSCKEKQSLAASVFRSVSYPSFLSSSSTPSSASSSSSSSSEVSALRFVRYLAGGSPQLVQPTALAVDPRTERVWVACRGGSVLAIKPDFTD